MAELSERACPACSAHSADRVGRKNGFDILQCTKCRSLYTSRLPSAGESENYDDYYSESNLTTPEFIQQRLEEIIGEFAQYRKLGRLLDIGFGAGDILRVARSLGWEVSGQEISRPAIDQAIAQGFDVFHGELVHAKYTDSTFDVVTASEIVEHLPDPHSVLREIHRVLRPGGVLWATTPSSRALSYRMLGTKWTTLSPPEHIQLYSKKGIRQMLNNAGFSDVKVVSKGLNPSEILYNFRPRAASVNFDRVGTSYKLNEQLTRSPFRRSIKSGLNFALDTFGLGDSLKIYARK